MSVEHCGKQQETPYCAYCGRKLWDNALGISGLMRHLHHRISSMEKQCGVTPSEEPGNPRLAGNLRRWRSWLDALEVLMKK